MIRLADAHRSGALMRTETAPLVPIAMAAMDSIAGFPTGLDVVAAAAKLRRELGDRQNHADAECRVKVSG
mgnify:CR=1 FL=1